MPWREKREKWGNQLRDSYISTHHPPPTKYRSITVCVCACVSECTGTIIATTSRHFFALLTNENTRAERTETETTSSDVKELSAFLLLIPPTQSRSRWMKYRKERKRKSSLYWEFTILRIAITLQDPKTRLQRNQVYPLHHI